LTPFSYSVLAELAGRAWYLYYDRLGFDPTPRSKVVRRFRGRPYFNISLPAQLEADHAGLEPLALQVNGMQQPLAAWEKPGFLAGLKLGRSQKKIDDRLAEYARQMGTITETARAWYLKTQAIQRWGQAEVLQIMEEIERVGVESMAAFLAARYNLGLHYARLSNELHSSAGDAQASLLISKALAGISGLVEPAMIDALLPIAAALREPAALAWLKAGDFANWRTQLPSQEAIELLKGFIDAYGHRVAFEGEIARPRWSEDVSLLLAVLPAQIEAPRTASPTPQARENLQALLGALPPSARKQGEQSIQKMGELHKLQSSALHGLTYIWAGTRTWALAAAREAMVDKRLQSQEEVFLFELEEIKQMMTGEWNISSLDEIHATTAKRQMEHAAMQQESAPDLLVGEDDAFAAHDALPAVAGTATAPLCLWDTKQDIRGAIVAAHYLDSGCTLALPHAEGFVAAAGTACDPFVVAAQGWQRPVAMSLGKRYGELADGVRMTLDVSMDGVTFTQG
jgi:hypothetical protein